jgi:hypothetical protein
MGRIRDRGPENEKPARPLRLERVAHALAEFVFTPLGLSGGRPQADAQIGAVV